MIPLRLIFGEKDRHEVFVDATDINIVTERTVAAFPVPIGSYRVAIDFNHRRIDHGYDSVAGQPVEVIPTQVPSPNTGMRV